MASLLCMGPIGGQRSYWPAKDAAVIERPNGDLAIETRLTCMGFRKGAWNWVRRLRGVDVYAVDFHQRFQPRRRRA